MAKQKEAYYFSHDSNARNDPNIVKMLTKYKYGYQWYFMIIEILRDQSNFKYKKDEYCFNAIAMQLHESAETIESFINDCVKEFYLLQENNEYYWSDSLLRRMKIKVEKSKTYSKNALKRWNKSDANSNAIALQGSNAKSCNKKKRKEKKDTTVSAFLPIELEGKISSTLWKEWTEYRKEIKKPITIPSIEKQVNFLLKQSNPVECIETAIRNGWQGLFGVNENGKSNKQITSGLTAVEFPGGDAFGEFAK